MKALTQEEVRALGNPPWCAGCGGPADACAGTTKGADGYALCAICVEPRRIGALWLTRISALETIPVALSLALTELQSHKRQLLVAH